MSKEKYSYEQKLKAVLNVTEKHMSYRTVAKLIGAGETPVYRWVKRYEQFGVEGLLLRKGTYDGQFKVSVVEYMHANQLSLNETAVLFGIPNEITLSKWERIYYEEGREALFVEKRGRNKMSNENKPRKLKLDKKVEEDLIAENQRLKMENAYLKKLNALVRERVQRENGKK